MMKCFRIVCMIVLASGLPACVSQAKYSGVLEETRLKEKQIAKLEKQLAELRERTMRLRDSIERINGY